MTQVSPTPPVDFTVETDKTHGVVYYTPVSEAAYDWSHGAPEGSATPRAGGMKGVTMFGQSFMFKSDNPRASKLRGFLKGDGYNVVVQAR
jgi:hypothetical protein